MAGFSWKLCLMASAVSLGGNFHFGYNIVVVNPMEDILQMFMNESFHKHYNVYLSKPQQVIIWSAMVTLLYLGCIFGLMLLPVLADRVGRKRSMYVTCGIFFLNAFPAALSKTLNSFELLAAARFITGIACGIVGGLQAMYLAEITPKEYRGFTGAFTGLIVEFGFGFCSLIALPIALGTSERWPLLFLVETVPSVILLFYLPFIPESAKYLLSKGKILEAESSIRKCYGKDVNVKEVVNEIQQEIAMQKTSMGVFEVFKDTSLRRSLVIGCLTNFAVPLSGIFAVANFTTELLVNSSGFSHSTATYLNSGVCCVSFFAAIGSAFMLDKFGRRPLFLGGSVLMIGLNLMVMAVLEVHRQLNVSWTGYVYFALTALFMLVFGLGPAPIQWFITGELVPQNARAASQSISLFCNYLGIMICGIAFYPLYESVGPPSFLLFVIPLSAFCLFFYFNFPETKGKTVEEVMKQLNHENPELVDYDSETSETDAANGSTKF